MHSTMRAQRHSVSDHAVRRAMDRFPERWADADPEAVRSDLAELASQAVAVGVTSWSDPARRMVCDDVAMVVNAGSVVTVMTLSQMAVQMQRRPACGRLFARLAKGPDGSGELAGAYAGVRRRRGRRGAAYAVALVVMLATAVAFVAGERVGDRVGQEDAMAGRWRYATHLDRRTGATWVVSMGRETDGEGK